jgi:hypothetical protein
MSDTGRQSFTDKASATMKVKFHMSSYDMYTYRLAQPDSQKGMLEHAGDKMKGVMDSGASAAQDQTGVGFFFVIQHHK